ncbi:MAG: glycosyltransferase family 39 protein [Cyanobacteria bacterium]|nr:glycosyltransferase family 39 protein [Cyanobacteriota bacterium]MDW8200583.1 glycosyltransferase family 39 protein [Cyanobacteriota bacterium SKYGB_h_bin112]
MQYNPYWLVIGITLIVRIAWALAVPVVPVGDSIAYDTFAQNLANGIGYRWDADSPTAYWPVGTSAVYALLYALFGHNYTPIVLFHILVAVVTSWGAMRLAHQWFGQQVALTTGWLLALWPSQIQFTTVLASELIFNALIILVLNLWFETRLKLWVQVGGVGILLAAASYVRPTALLIPVLLVGFRWLNTKEIWQTLVMGVATSLLMLGLILPWSYRNAQVFGEFVLISTNGGANLWMGNNPKSTGEYMPLPPEVASMDEAKRNRYLKDLAKEHIRQRPLLFLRRTVQRTIITHSRESIGVVWNADGLTQRYGTWVMMPLKVLNQVYWLLMLGLGLAGGVMLIQQFGWFTGITHPLIVLWGYFAAIHAVIVAQDRYHFPSIPMIATLAAFAIVSLLGYRQMLKQTTPQPSQPHEVN